MFQKWREVRRLKRELREARAELKNALTLLEDTRKLLLERDMLFVDRFLVYQTKTYAIGDEAKIKTVPIPQFDPDKKDRELQAYLSDKRDILREQALEAGVPEDAIDASVNQMFNKNEQIWVADFNFNYTEQ